MSKTSSNDFAAGNSILGWMGLNKSAAPSHTPEVGAEPAAPMLAKMSLAQQARSELLETISTFLLSNDLEVTSENLLAAHSIFSGDNAPLARQVRQQSQVAGKVTQQWLDKLMKEDPARQELADIEKLMAKTEESIGAFTETARAAHSASSEYGSELEKHTNALKEPHDPSEMLHNLAELASVMLSQTRKVEAEMRQSEEEANSLRKKLDRAKRDAEVDHLTGLPNRRAFEAQLERHYREAQKNIDPLCVAFCDIDHFKKINDTHGHDTGDRVIKAIAETLGAISDDNCHVARHGGEEFVMLFRNAAASEAYAALDQVREQLATKKFVNRKTDQPIGQVTFSGGIADVFAYDDPREALSAADEALYRAKSSGRNQIVLAKEAAQ